MKRIIFIINFLIIILAYALDSDVTLKSYSVNGINKILDSNWYNNETVTFPAITYSKTTMAMIEITANNNKAAILYNKNVDISNKITDVDVSVKSEDGREKIYVIRIIRATNDSPTWEETQKENEIFDRLSEVFLYLKNNLIDSKDSIIKKAAIWLAEQPEVAYVYDIKPNDRQIQAIFKSGSYSTFVIRRDAIPDEKNREQDKVFREELKKTDDYDIATEKLIKWIYTQENIAKVWKRGEKEKAITTYYKNGEETTYIINKTKDRIELQFKEYIKEFKNFDKAIEKLIEWVKKYKKNKILKVSKIEDSIIIHVVFEVGDEATCLIKRIDL